MGLFNALLSLIVQGFFGFLIIALFLAAILTWFPGLRESTFMGFLNRMIAPVTAPLAQRIPTVGILSIAYLIAFWILFFLRGLTLYALFGHS